MVRACIFHFFGLFSYNNKGHACVERRGREREVVVSGPPGLETGAVGPFGFPDPTACISHRLFSQTCSPGSTLSWPEAGTVATHLRPPGTLPDLAHSIPADLEGPITHHSPLSPCAQITSKNTVPITSHPKILFPVVPYSPHLHVPLQGP